jgi:hypothetical protein
MDNGTVRRNSRISKIIISILPTALFVMFVVLTDPLPAAAGGQSESMVITGLTSMPGLPSWCPVSSIPTITMPSLTTQSVQTPDISWPDLEFSPLSLTVQITYGDFYAESVASVLSATNPVQSWISTVISYVNAINTKVGTYTAFSISATLTLSDAQLLLQNLASAELGTMTLSEAAAWIGVVAVMPFAYLRGAVDFFSEMGTLGLLAGWGLLSSLWVLLVIFIRYILVPIGTAILSWIIKLLELIGAYVPTGG